MRYLCGLDLGQVQDYSALVIAEQHGASPQARYAVRHLERFPLGTAYPAIVTRVQTLLQTPPLRGLSTLVVDATGVGRPVVDMMDQATLSPVAVSIHGGDQVTQDGKHFRVPKRDLVGVLQVLLQTQRLTVAEALLLAQVLVAELLSFKVTLNAVNGHDSYAAWREQDHNDLVLAVALACWWGERRPQRSFGTWGR